MLLRMSEKSRREYLEIKRKRYRLLRGKKAKGQILSEVEEMTGYSRKQIIRLMRETREAKSKKRDKRGRPEKLKASDIEVIKEIWLKSEQPCGKRLKAVLEDWLPYYEEEKGKMEPFQRAVSEGLCKRGENIVYITSGLKVPMFPKEEVEFTSNQTPIGIGFSPFFNHV
jgi:transposase